ncbi:hypothetical protein AVEN_154137-1 [Araneus ventricosus]|uniref:Uncharacterized protein n=1 Tax=Araneus ventricosus TaxID=182803 RepID=A0A4Y2VEJ7_ARAVE|nr:hypothetical protein AVEN_154137-1 [Araneus ventricosus]
MFLAASILNENLISSGYRNNNSQAIIEGLRCGTAGRRNRSPFPNLSERSCWLENRGNENRTTLTAEEVSLPTQPELAEIRIQ